MAFESFQRATSGQSELRLVSQPVMNLLKETFVILLVIVSGEEEVGVIDIQYCRKEQNHARHRRDELDTMTHLLISTR